MGQLTLFRTSALVKLSGTLMITSAVPSIGRGSCPVCKSKEFRLGTCGWTECAGEGCDFAILTSHLEEIHRSYL